MISTDDAAGRATLAPAAALFRSLADQTRLAILLALQRGDARVVDLTIALSLSQATVSQHLECLRCCGLVESQPVGRASRYSLVRGSLDAVLLAAESLLEETGHAVSLCPTYGEAAP